MEVDVDPLIDRRPIVLVLDCSGDMMRQVRPAEGIRCGRLTLVEDGLDTLTTELSNTEQQPYPSQFDLGVVSCGPGVRVTQSFVPLEKWTPPELSTGGDAELLGAIERGVNLLEARKEEYEMSGIPYQRPFISVLAHSAPTDAERGGEKWERVKSILEIGVRDGHLDLFPAGATETGREALQALTTDIDCQIQRVALPENGYQEYFERIATEAKSTPLARPFRMSDDSLRVKPERLKPERDDNEYCSECGADLSNYGDPNFCPKCGASTDSTDNSDTEIYDP